jgi:hypothetical protein
MVENRLRWFGHVKNRLIDQTEESEIRRGRGRPRKTIRETVRKDLEVNELDLGMVYDRRGSTIWRT